VNNIATDVGGEVYYYLEKYKDQIKERYIDQWGVLVDIEPPFEVNYSGCGQMFANFDKGEVEIRDYQESNLRTFHIKHKEKITGNMHTITLTLS
jgi:hypothetical protein